MKKIKEFFDKKQNDLKFKSAGAGHKLSDTNKTTTPTSSTSSRPAEVAAASSARRTGPDSNVANAALARFGDKTSNAQQKTATKPTLHDIMAKEKRKATEEMKLKDELKELELAKKQSSSQEQKNPFKELEDSQRFTCTTLDITSPLPFKELMCSLKGKIFDNFGDDPILRSSMCLFNCNRTVNQDPTQLQSCLDILKKIVTNLQTNNLEELEKFKKIRRSKIEQKVLSQDGALDFLFAIGFTIDTDVEWLVNVEQDEEFIKKMQFAQDLLDSPQIIPIELDRSVKYITDEANIPPDSNEDLKLTSSEFKQFYSNLEKTREINEMFISKDAKTKLLANYSTNFKSIFAKLKFKLSLTDNEIETVEAVFYANEKLSDVKSWLVATFSPLFDGKDVHFKVGPELFAADSLSKSLTDLKLSPAATLIVIAK